MIDGGGGDDQLTGGAGTDTAGFTGTAAGYSITQNDDGTVTVVDGTAGRDGTDQLSGVETLAFSDSRTLLVGGSGFATIQEAVDAAQDGDTILVKAGTYAITSAIVIDKAVTLLGEQAGVDPRGAAGLRTAGDGSETIIDGGGISTLIQVAADGVTIDGFDIRNGSGDLITSSSSGTIADPVIQYSFIHDSSGDEGIQLRNASDAVIQFNNVFDTAGDGINLAGSSTGGQILSNEVHDIASTNAAIYLDGAQNSLVQGNLIYAVTGNDGIKLGDKGGSNAGDSGGQVVGNVIHDTAQDGISVYMSNVTVSGNEIHDSHSANGAIFVEFAVDNIAITGNDIHDNGIAGDGNTTFGIRVGKDSTPTNVTITGNSLTGNEAQIFHQEGSLTNAATLVADNTFDDASTANVTLTVNTVFGDFSTIQAAIDAAAPGDTIYVGAGTYAGGIVIDKALNIVGADGAVIAGTITGSGGGPGSADLDSWLQTHSSYSGDNGITVEADGVTLQNLDLSGFKWGVVLGDTDGTTLRDLDISQSVVGITNGYPTTNGQGPSITNLTIDGGSISHGQHGITINASKEATADPSVSVGTGAFSDVTINGLTLSDLNEKGIYLEQAQDLTITGALLTDVGEYGRTPSFGGDGLYGAGIELNLKYGDYSNILIDDFTLTGVGHSYGADGIADPTGAGIAIHARDDGSNYGNPPATLDGVTISNGTIDGTYNGIKFTDAGASDVTIDGVTVGNAENSPFFNGSPIGVTILLGDGAQTLDASSGSLDGSAGFTIDGGGGDDVLIGSAGDDTALYHGDRAGYDLSAQSDGGVTVADSDTGNGDEGTDDLTGIEQLVFADGTVSFGATLGRAAAEHDGGGTDGFHPGSGLTDTGFVINDNTDVGLEVALKAHGRFSATVTSDGATYYSDAGITTSGSGLQGGTWNFDYSVIDYGANPDLSKYDVRIAVDYTDLNGNRSTIVSDFDPVAHDAATGEHYYDDPSGATDGLQNSQNLLFDSIGANGYDPNAYGNYDVSLTVTDKASGAVVGESDMLVRVAPDIVVAADGSGDYTTIQAAIDAAQAGDTIVVAAGSYTPGLVDYITASFGAGRGTLNQQILVDKSLTLIGLPGATIQVAEPDSTALADRTLGFTVAADDVSISGFEIVGPLGDVQQDSFDFANRGYNYGIFVDEGVLGTTLSGNTIQDLRTGITFEGANGDTLDPSHLTSVTGNEIDNTRGAFLVRSEGVELSDNSFGAEGNEWDLTILAGTQPGDYFADPLVDVAQYGDDMMALSTANDGMTIVDRRYGEGGVLTQQYASSDPALSQQYAAIANRTHVEVRAGADDTPSAALGETRGNGFGSERLPIGSLQDGVDAVVKGGSVHAQAGDYSGETVAVATENLTVDGDAGAIGIALQLASGIEAVTATGAADVALTGNETANLLAGGEGDDVLFGGGAADALTGGGGNDSLVGGEGTDTAHFTGAQADYAIALNDDGSFTVADGSAGRDGSDHLSGVEQLAFGDGQVLLVGGSGFDSLQGAIDAASDGDTILVYPGQYSESANYNPNTGLNDPSYAGGNNPLGLVIGKSVTIQGVDSAGHAITDHGGVEATISATRQSNFGTSFLVTADHVAIHGLELLGNSSPNQPYVNKVIEVIADGFTLDASVVGAVDYAHLHTQPTAADNLSGSWDSHTQMLTAVYFNDWYSTVPSDLAGWQSAISSYDVEGSQLAGTIEVASGPGYGYAADQLDMRIVGNLFINVAADDPTWHNNGILITGQDSEIGWRLAPAALPTEISGNVFGADGDGIFWVRGEGAQDLPDLAYVQSLIANNDLPAYAYAVDSSGAPAIGTYDGDFGPLLPGGVPVTPSSPSFAIRQSAGDFDLNELHGADSLVVKGEADAASRTLSLIVGSDGADNLSGGSGDEALLGGGGDDRIDGGGGNDLILGGAGDDVLFGGAGNDTLAGGDGSDTVTGGQGDDQVVFQQGESGSDSVTDMSGGDALDFSDVVQSDGPAELHLGDNTDGHVQVATAAAPELPLAVVETVPAASLTVDHDGNVTLTAAA